MSEPIYEDPVVAEIHATRAQMLAECGEDYQEFMKRLRERQKASGRKVIPAPPATDSSVVVLEPRLAGQPPPRVWSPRLADPSQAPLFKMEVTEEKTDA